VVINAFEEVNLKEKRSSKLKVKAADLRCVRKEILNFKWPRIVKENCDEINQTLTPTVVIKTYN
jgi:hypothetical protein